MNKMGVDEMGINPTYDATGAEKAIMPYVNSEGQDERAHPCSLRSHVLTSHAGLNNLDRRSPKEHFCYIKQKSVQWLLNFPLYIGKINPVPW